ncbi:D123-domain-containing protein [Hyaloraphidium curvatum]|nr:D123-domain-containing protein [Hyaloraphidium curvatum]
METDPVPAPPHTPPLPRLTRAHVDRCAFHSWFPRFRGVTFASRVIGPLPPAFVDYLHADGVFLPLDSNGDPQPALATSDAGSDTSEETCSEANDGDAWLQNIPSFPELEEQISAAIAELGGTVFPKLSWTAPRDASWVALNNSLKCSTPADVFLLLKSSDFVAHDLGNPYISTRGEEPPPTPDPDDEESRPPEELYLVLRKWIEVEPSMEFRCFVRRKELIAISQRDTFNFYPFLPSMKPELLELIGNLFASTVRDRFDEENYTFDVYVSRRSGTPRALVVDFNPYAYYTDALLFSWDELASWGGPLEFRIVDSGEHARECARGWANPKFSSSRLPVEASILPDVIREAQRILS